MELSLKRRLAIERKLGILAESKSAQLRRDRRLKHLFYLTVFMSILFVVCVIVMLACGHWEPGDQENIYSQYKAHRFEAEFEFPSTGEVATK
jgi:hypothetical protein